MTYSVIGCPECSHHWIVVNIQHQDRCECPRCGHSRKSSRCRKFGQADDWEAICEIRSRILANRSGHLDEYTDVGTYAEISEAAGNCLSEYDEEYEDQLTDTIAEHREEFAAHVERMHDRPTKFEGLVDTSIEDHRKKFQTLADEVSGSVVTLDEQIRGYYGPQDGRDGTLSEADVALPSDPELPEPSDRAGLRLTEQAPIEATATVELDGRPPSEVWNDLTSFEAFQVALVSAARDAGRGRTHPEYHDVLEDAEIDALHGSFRSLVLGVAQGNESSLWALLRETRGFGNGSGLEDAADASRLFALALENCPDCDVPTLTFTIEPAFREQRADQRREIFSIVAELARGCDVSLVGGGLTQRWIVEQHRTDLPVSRECITTPTRGPLSELVETALGELNPDSKKVKALRELADEPTETLSRKQLKNILRVSRSRLSQILVVDEDSLTKLGLVDEFESGDRRMVELLEGGREYLSQISRQISLKESVSDTGKPYSQITCNPESKPGGEDGQFYRTVVERRPNKTAASACGLDNDVCFVQESVELDETAEERKTKPVSYDENQDIATVSVRAGEGLPYLVSVATTLATPWFLDDTLPNSRLEAIDEPSMILREGRNIGGLSDRALGNLDELRTTLVEWGDNLERLTTEFHHAKGDDKKALGSKVMKQSHGLTGSIVHLLDAAGIDVVREIRVPSGRGTGKLENLSESIARSMLIQSKYGVFAPYRHFFKTDAGKPLISPDVDAKDPVGSLIGSFVIRGKDTHRLRGLLEAALSNPGEFLDDLPEFTIPVSVREAGRSEFAVTVTRLLKSKNLRPTRESVSIAHTYTSSPYDAARALNQLEAEDSVRDVRPDEIRYALATLEVERILPKQSPTVSKVVHALLRANEPLSQAALADVAGVSERSIRNNRAALEALDIVSVDGRGWRLNLSFRTTEERRAQIVPEFVGSTFLEAVDALLTELLPAERYGDPSDPVGGVLFYPQDPWKLLDDVDLSSWIELAARLTGTDPPERESVVSVGPAIEQTAITTEVAV